MGTALDQATAKLLQNRKSPSRKVKELDNRGSQFYIALYWAEALANQNQDQELKSRFAPLAKQLAENEAKIIEELNAVQGKPVDIGGYYSPNLELARKAMRPSETFNKILASVQ
jgi:isocitrate dehydrogenase